MPTLKLKLTPLYPIQSALPPTPFKVRNWSWNGLHGTGLMKDGYHHGSNWVHGWVDKDGVSWLMNDSKDGYLGWWRKSRMGILVDEGYQGWVILVDEGNQGWVSWLMKDIKNGYLGWWRKLRMGILVDEGYQGWVSWLMKDIKDGYVDWLKEK